MQTEQRFLVRRGPHRVLAEGCAWSRDDRTFIALCPEPPFLTLVCPKPSTVVLNLLFWHLFVLNLRQLSWTSFFLHLFVLNLRQLSWTSSFFLTLVCPKPSTVVLNLFLGGTCLSRILYTYIVSVSAVLFALFILCSGLYHLFKLWNCLCILYVDCFYSTFFTTLFL